MNCRALVLAGVVLASLPTRSSACQCPIPAPGQSIPGARLIFAVHVTGPRGHDGRFPARVLAVWKGDLPESTTVALTGACGYAFDAGHDYLVFIHSSADSIGHAVGLCSGTRPLENAYLDRYLLGTPVIRYDDAYEPVTLDTMVKRIGESDGERFAPEFADFRIESALLVPRLRRMARAELPGNQLAAVRAIDALGETASDAYPDLFELFDLRTKHDVAMRAAALSAMLSVNRDYHQNRKPILEAIQDPAPDVRAVVFEHIWHQRQSDEKEVRKIVWRGLTDEDPKIRTISIRGCRFSDFSDATAKKIKDLARTDPSNEVVDAASEYLDTRERNRVRR